MKKTRWMRPPTWLYVMFAIGLAFLTIRYLASSPYKHSAILYISIPFFLSILLHQLVGHASGTSVTARYFNHFRNATIVMLATSGLLFEGFICVLMFMPIYYFFVTLGFIFDYLHEREEKNKTKKLGTYAIPVIVVILSLEGVVKPLTNERNNQVTHTVVVSQSVAHLQANMARPIALGKDRHWFLSLFPLPVSVEAGSLRPGDVHKLHFIYKRWFFTNVHDGHMRLKIVSVSDRRVRTEIVENTSYLANYMQIKGTEVRFTPLTNGKTRVSLTVEYRRLLDPSWYFGPLQRFAAKLSAEYLIQSVIARGGYDV